MTATDALGNCDVCMPAVCVHCKHTADKAVPAEWQPEPGLLPELPQGLGQCLAGPPPEPPAQQYADLPNPELLPLALQ